MKLLLLNLALGFIPPLIYGASLAAGIDDDPRHRRVFFLVYGLWAFTLAGWNWVSSGSVVWIAVWTVFGVIAMVLSRRRV